MNMCNGSITARYLPSAVPGRGERVTLKLLSDVLAITQTESATFWDGAASLITYTSCANLTVTGEHRVWEDGMIWWTVWHFSTLLLPQF